MKRRSLLLVLAGILPLPLSAAVCELHDSLFLQAETAIHYEFSQSKTVAALSRPLVSSGVLGRSSGGELIWQTLKPLKSTMVISASGLKQFDRNDVLVNELDNPVAEELAQVFLSLLSGDTRTLETAFTQTLSCDGSNWQLRLVPNSERLAELLAWISLDGNAHIGKVSFKETRGDYTEILLSSPLDDQSDSFGIYLGD